VWFDEGGCLNENRKSVSQQEPICPNDLILLRDSGYEPTVMKNKVSGCKMKHKANREAGQFSFVSNSFGRIHVRTIQNEEIKPGSCKEKGKANRERFRALPPFGNGFSPPDRSTLPYFQPPCMLAVSTPLPPHQNFPKTPHVQTSPVLINKIVLFHGGL
jgi:hypothetical protein